MQMSGLNTPLKNKFHVIPDTPSSIVESDEASIAKARKKLTDDEDTTIIAYAGSFASYQGIDILFDLLPTVLESHPKAIFVVIGGSEAEIAFYKDRFKNEPYSDRILFLGKIAPDLLPAYLSASDILLAPRKSGINSPLKILDYFKAKAAIVATNTVANQRLLDSDNAVLCEFDKQDFSNAISGLIEHPEKRIRLAQNAHKQYQTTYNFENFKSQINQAYQLINPAKTAN